jgi:hypothetical protein
MGANTIYSSGKIQNYQISKARFTNKIKVSKDKVEIVENQQITIFLKMSYILSYDVLQPEIKQCDTTSILYLYNVKIIDESAIN